MVIPRIISVLIRSVILIKFYWEITKKIVNLYFLMGAIISSVSWLKWLVFWTLVERIKCTIFLNWRLRFFSKEFFSFERMVKKFSKEKRPFHFKKPTYIVWRSNWISCKKKIFYELSKIDENGPYSLNVEWHFVKKIV